MQADLLHVEEALWILVAPTGMPIYDFAFDTFLACRRPYQPPEGTVALARIGAIADPAALAAACAERGVALLQSDEQHRLASELPRWQPRVAELTPESAWYREPPPPEVIEATLGWPMFMKGARQTSRHSAALHVIDGPDAYVAALAAWRADPVLHWQDVVCRRLLPLRRVPGDSGDGKIPPSFELRTFFWRGQLAGVGRYWYQAPPYPVTPREEADALAVAQEAARRVDVPFLVVDVAQDVDGRWWVIECNDGQESGYAAISPFALWQRIVELERAGPAR
jgi:hypothetical protein